MKETDIQYYIAIAKEAAKRSKASRLQVGAVLVNENHINAVGYNGTPSGWSNICEIDDKTVPEVIHGEMNALFKFVNEGISTKGCSLFLTHSPCLDCAKALYLAGVSNIYYVDEYRSLDGIDFLRKGGCQVKKIG